jgi:hypothetical protein
LTDRASDAAIEEVYFGKAKDVVSELRSKFLCEDTKAWDEWLTQIDRHPTLVRGQPRAVSA